jgi:hypothetical protein
MSDQPDFYIYGREGVGLGGVRSCWKLSVVHAGERSVLLIRVSPGIEKGSISSTETSGVVGLTQRVERPF